MPSSCRSGRHDSISVPADGSSRSTGPTPVARVTCTYPPPAPSCGNLHEGAPHKILIEGHRERERAQRERLRAGVAQLEREDQPAAVRVVLRHQLALHADGARRLVRLSLQRHVARVAPEEAVGVPIALGE
eukprot:6215670-Prymnesium_polylepis.1